MFLSVSIETKTDITLGALRSVTFNSRKRRIVLNARNNAVASSDICSTVSKVFSTNRAWAEIDLELARKNYQIVSNSLQATTKICCVVKANAYGHGSVRMAQLYESLGASYLAVATLEEALQLRQAKIKLPILILGYTSPQYADVLSDNDITQCVYSLDYGRALSSCATEKGKTVKIHIKIDTGMGRIGFRYVCGDEQELTDAQTVCRMQGLTVEGIFTHFSSADDEIGSDETTERQYQYFLEAISCLEKRGIQFSIRHCSNSAAILKYPHMQLDMVRAGISLYGLESVNSFQNKVNFQQILQLKTIVSHIKLIHKGEAIGYGQEYVAEKDTIIATLPIGYADGLWRSNSRHGMLVNINNEYAPIIGRICMDQCMIDITALKEVHVGDIVTVYGDSEINSIDKIAEINKTISYEIVCSVSERVPRQYINKEK